MPLKHLSRKKIVHPQRSQLSASNSTIKENLQKQKTVLGYPIPTFIFFTFLVALIIGLAVIRLFYQPSATPTFSPTLMSVAKLPKPVLPSSALNPLSLGQVNNQITGSQLPNSYPAFTASSSAITATVAASLAKQFGMEILSKTDKEIDWQNTTSYLTADIRTDTIAYLFSFPANRTALSGSDQPTYESATQSAETSLRQWSIWNDRFVSDPSGAEYLASAGLDLVPLPTPTLTLEAAGTPSAQPSPDVVRLKYHDQVNGTKVITDSHRYPLFVNVGHHGVIIGFTYTPFPGIKDTIGTYPLLLSDQIPDALRGDYARLIDVLPDLYGSTPSTTVLSQATLSSVEFRLYYSPSQNIFYPAYLVSGHGKFSDGTSAGLTFLVIAVNPGYFD